MIDLANTDAAKQGVGDGDLVEIRSTYGTAIRRARVTDEQVPGSAFMAMHWTDQYTARSVVGALVNPTTDPWSGQPELKHTPISIRSLKTGWAGFLISRRALRPTGFVHWSKRAIAGGWLYHLTGPEPTADGILLARRLIDTLPRDGAIEYHDIRRGTFRSAFADSGGRLTDCLFVGRSELQFDPAWLIALLAEDRPLRDADRRALLSGRAPLDAVSEGRIVCSCFQVGIDRIAAAVRNEGLADTAALGRRLQCGTNCGSCLPELRGIIADERRFAAE